MTIKTLVIINSQIQILDFRQENEEHYNLLPSANSCDKIKLLNRHHIHVTRSCRMLNVRLAKGKKTTDKEEGDETLRRSTYVKSH